MSPPTSFSSVCSSSPAPHKSTTAAATSPDTSRLRKRLLVDVADRLSDAITPASDPPVACHAGMTPNTTPTASAAARPNSTTRVERGRYRRRQQTRRNQRWRGLENRGADADAQQPAKHREHEALGEQ